MTPPARRPPGGVPVDIPEKLIGMLDASYRSGQPIYVDVEDVNSPDVKELTRFARIHARRTGKSLRIFSAPAGAGSRLELRIRDKQIYTRKGTTSE